MDDWSTFNNAQPSAFKKPASIGINTATSTTQSAPNFQSAFSMTQLQQEEPIFQLERQQDILDSQGDGFVSFATAANCIVIATASNRLIRWFIEGDEDEKNILLISNRPEERVFELWVSPDAKHILVSMTNGVLYYLPTDPSVIKPVQIQKFKEIVQSTAWYQYDSDFPTQTASSTASSPIAQSINPIQRVLLGTTNGSLFELVIEGSHERSIKKLYDLAPNTPQNGSQSNIAPISIASAITGIRIFRAGIDDKVRNSNIANPTVNFTAPRWHVTFVTSSHKYQLSGGPTIEAVFTNATGTPISFVELPGGLIVSNQLTTYTAPPPPSISSTIHAQHVAQGLAAPSSYAWITTAGVYYAQIDANCAVSPPPHTSDPFSCSEGLVEFPKIQDIEYINQRLALGEGIGHKTTSSPISIVITRLHAILLFRQHLAIVNLVSGAVVMSCPLNKATFGSTKRLCCDETNGTYWLLTDNAVYEIIASDEARDIWRTYLVQGDYENAYQFATTPTQSKIIATHHADALFQQGEYSSAAKQYIRSLKTFEAVCMKYLSEYQSRSNQVQRTGMNSFQTDTNQRKQPGLPGNLFTPTHSTLFGPDGRFASAFEDAPLSGSGLISANGPKGSDGNANAGLIFNQQSNNTQESSLSLLNSIQLLSTPSSTQVQQTTSSGTATYNFFVASFQSMAIKWSIYNGLKTYLKLMLSRISQTDKTKLTTLSSWVVELSINTLVALQTSFFSDKHPQVKDNSDSQPRDPRDDSAIGIHELEEQRLQLHDQERQDLYDFFDEFYDCLHPTTTYRLLSSAGRTTECLYYAQLNKHHSYVLELYTRDYRFAEALNYLKSLRRPKTHAELSQKKYPVIDLTMLLPMLSEKSKKQSSQSQIVLNPLSHIFTIEPDLIYRIIPTLLQHSPTETVNLLIETDGLQCTHVLTSMVRSGLHIEYYTNNSISSTATNDLFTGSGIIIDPSKQALQTTLNSMGVRTTTLPSSTSQSQLQQNNVNVHSHQHINQSLENPSNIKSISTKADSNKSPNTQYIHDVTRYLYMLIGLNLAPIAVHNLYVTLLIQLKNAQQLYTYLSTHKHTTYPNRTYALRLALPHVDLLYASVIEICLQLQRHTLAVRFALKYDIVLAKRILQNYSTSSTLHSIPVSQQSTEATSGNDDSGWSGCKDTEQLLWGEYVRLLLQQGLTINQIVDDIRSWNSSTNQKHLDKDGKQTGIVNYSTTQADNRALFRILPSLPSTTTIADIQPNVINQLVDFNTQLQQLNLDMSVLQQTNMNLKLQLNALQKQIVTISTSQRCDICSQPVLLSPFIYFRCGHTFHVSCAVKSVYTFFSQLAPPLSYESEHESHAHGNSASLSKKQSIYLRLLNDLLEQYSTTASLSQTITLEVSHHFYTDEMIDLASIHLLKQKVMRNELASDEELFFIEEYAQQSCCQCSEMMIESIGLQVNHIQSIGDSDDWSL